MKDKMQGGNCDLQITDFCDFHGKKQDKTTFCKLLADFNELKEEMQGEN